MTTYDGRYGGIPDRNIFDKLYGQTDVDEGDYAEVLDDDWRHTLKDLSPDEPWLESDQARNGGYDPKTGEARNGGSMSRGMLSLRFNGKRHEAEPYIPDQFLDHEFLVPDPRGQANEPDFNAFNEQKRARGKFIKFYNDDDLSVPESGVNPTTMVKNIRQLNHSLGRERLKIFSTSKDNMVTGYNPGHVSNSSRIPHISMDGTIVELSAADALGRTNYTTILSNVSELGWQSTPDQEFKVAKYGAMRGAMPLAQISVEHNRRSGGEVDDSALPVEFKGQIVSSALALTMDNYIRNKGTKMFTADGNRWDDSVELETRDAIYAAKTGGASEVFKLLEMSGLGIDTTREQGVRKIGAIDGGREHFNSEITSTHIADFMEQATRSARQDTSDNIRHQVEVIVRGDSNEVGARSMRNDSNPVGAQFESEIGRMGDSNEVKNYSHVPAVSGASNMGSFEFSQHVDGSLTREHRNVRHKHGSKGKTHNISDVVPDTDFESSADNHYYGLSASAMNDKATTRRYMQSTHNNDDYNTVQDL
jgi:hypothetical protein